MHFVEKDLTQKRIDLDTKLKSNKILRVPGAYNPLTAKLIEEIGYDAVYVSGGVMANDLGFPDIGLTTLQDCLLYTSPSPRDSDQSRMPSSA